MSILLLGLDGTPWSILHKWMAKGQLPTFKKIYENSMHGTLISTIPTYTCPALPTLFTGKSQGKIGIFGFTYPDNTPVSLRTMRDFKIWDILSQNGKVSCIVNVRMLYPVEKLNGIMISGNPAPSEESDYVYPEELKKRVAGFRHVEDDRLSEELTIDPQKNKEKILELRIRMTKHRYHVFKMLNLEKKYDFSFFWIGGTDFMGHWFWDDEETYLRYFKEVDIILKDILQTFNGWDLLIISDHGMQGVQKKKFYVNTWLEKLGYLKYKGNIFSQSIRKVAAPTLSVLLSKKRKERIKNFFNKSLGSGRMGDVVNDSSNNSIITKLEYGAIHNIDWDETKAYLVNDWGIEIRVSNKNDEYHKIREDIIEKMKSLVDNDGKKIVKEVWRKEEIFNGPYLDEIPDIVFILTEDYGMGILPSRKITGVINKDQYERGNGRYFRGDHEGAIEGILMAIGPNFKQGELSKKAGLMDIMPTILHMLNVDIPDDIDGNVLKELFKEDSQPFIRDVKKRNYGSPVSTQKHLSPEENKAIIESLKQMGYM
jgi:predicted AlkP superfamily phosphohydrolase/phosphomutase